MVTVGNKGFQVWNHEAIRRTYHLRCEPMDEAFRHALEPLLASIGSATTYFAPLNEQDCQSIAHSIVALWLGSDLRVPDGQLVDRYEAAVAAVTRAWRPRSYGGDPSTQPALLLVLRLLNRDAQRLPPPAVLGWCSSIIDCEYREAEHLPQRWVPGPPRMPLS